LAKIARYYHVVPKFRDLLAMTKEGYIVIASEVWKSQELYLVEIYINFRI